MIKDNTGRTIVFLRQKAGMTQAQLAAVLDVTSQAVSKWENGQASPDYENMLKLARLFGVTIEQIITGEVPGMEKSVNNDTAEALKGFAEKAAKTALGIGGSIVNTVGKAINSAGEFVSDIYAGVTANDTAKEVNDAQEKTAEDSPVIAEREDSDKAESISLETLVGLAPFMSKDKLTEEILKSAQIPTIEQLRGLAPYITSNALETLLRRCAEPVDADTLIKLAPYIRKEQLFALIAQCPDALTVDNLRRFAPFLKRNMVDTLVETINKAKDAAESSEFLKQAGNVAGNLCNKLNDVVRSAVDTIKPEKAESPFPENAERKVMSSELKDKVARAALEARSWVWLRSHIEEISDEALLLDIAKTAAAEQEQAELFSTAVQKLSAEKIGELISTLSDNKDYAKLVALAPYAEETVADRAVEKACMDYKDVEAARDAVKAYAVRASKEKIEGLTAKAISENDWELIELLTSAM